MRKAKWWLGCGLFAVVAATSWSLAGRQGVGAPQGHAAFDAASGSATPSSPSPVIPLQPSAAPIAIALDPDVLDRAHRAKRLAFVAPGGRPFVFRLDGREPAPGGATTLTGRTATRLGPQSLVLTYRGRAVFGVVPLPDGRQLQVETSRGRVTARLARGLIPAGAALRDRAIDDFAIPDQRRPAVAGAVGLVALDRPEGDVHVAGSASRAVAELPVTPVSIDVLAVYSDDLVTLRGDAATAETDVASQFAVANRAHDDSATGVRFRVAGMRRATIDPARTNDQVLRDATNNVVAGLDIHALRNEVSADLVAVIRPYHAGDGTCGIAWLNGAALWPEGMSDRYGFAVADVDGCGAYVLAHELGHSLGSTHDRANVPTNGGTPQYGAYAFSFGHRQDGAVPFATVMAYAQGAPWLGRFSDPAASACGARCGIPDEADNVRSIRLTAARVEAFRGRPGTLSIGDGSILEPDPGAGTTLVFTVRYSGAAPAGGIRFDVERADGTATPDVDYTGFPVRDVVIPEGQSEGFVYANVQGDELIEPDETIVLRLANVRGADVERAEARGLIINDDPRAQIRGRIRFPEGATLPNSNVLLKIMADGRVDSYASAYPPDFTYRASVVPGSAVTIVPEAVPSPFVAEAVALGRVDRSRERDLFATRGLRVSGRLVFADGVAAGPVQLEASASSDGVVTQDRFFQLDPANPEFEISVAPGAWVRLKADLAGDPTPPHLAIDTDVRADWRHDVLLSTLPSITVWNTPRLPEGAPGTHGSSALIVQLSAPAPAGGVGVRYRTVDGRAKAGEDYRAVAGELTFAEGERVKSIELEWYGDDRVERDEDFFVEFDGLRGATAGNLHQRQTIFEPTPDASTPLPALRLGP